jgi:hypothetical protein
MSEVDIGWCEIHPGVDSAFIAWRASFIDQCRGFALKRKVRRAPGSAASPNTTSGPSAHASAHARPWFTARWSDQSGELASPYAGT